MVEGDMKNDPDQQKDQGYQSYIEICFQTVSKLQQYSLPQLCLIPSKSIIWSLKSGYLSKHAFQASASFFLSSLCAHGSIISILILENDFVFQVA